jgi:hypothetical protein
LQLSPSELKLDKKFQPKPDEDRFGRGIPKGNTRSNK